MSDLKKLGILACGIIIPPIIFYILVYYLLSKAYFQIELVTAAVLLATLIAIVAYTWVTWKLKDLTSKQTTYQIRPFVVFITNERGIKNMGNGIALNIKIDKIPIKNCKGGFVANDEEKESHIVFTSIGCLEKDGESHGLHPYMLNKKGEKRTLNTKIDYAIYNLSESSMTEFPMCITYHDIENTRCKTHMNMEGRYFQVVGIDDKMFKICKPGA